MNLPDLNNIRFTLGNYEENILDIESLCKTWHKERKYVQTFKGIEFNPDREYFNLLNGTGDLIVLCMFDVDELVGAYLGYKSPCMQDKEIILSHVLLWCMHKDYRNTSLTLKLLSEIDRVLKEQGVDIYSLCLDELPKYKKLEKYLTCEANTKSFTKIESYYYRDLREVPYGSSG